MMIEARQSGAMVVWGIAVDGHELACRGVACRPGKMGMVELVAFGHSLPPGLDLSGGRTHYVELLVGRWREAGRVESGWGRITDLSRGKDDEFRLSICVEIPLDKPERDL